MAEAIALAKELNDMLALTVALWAATILAQFEGDPAEVERLASDRAWNSGVAGRQVPYYLGLKAEALHLAGRTSEALDATIEAEAVIERREQRWWSAELYRHKGVFLAAMGAQETQIEASFCEAIRTANEQKSVSLQKRAEATYAEYSRQKARGQEAVDFDYLFADILQCSAFRSIKQNQIADV